MNLIKSHLELELSRQKPNLYLVSQLQGVLKTGSLSFEKWHESGMFIPVEEFKIKYPHTPVSVGCAQVIEYLGMIFIEVLKDGTFYYNDVLNSKSLDTLEVSVWDIHLNKKFNI